MAIAKLLIDASGGLFGREDVRNDDVIGVQKTSDVNGRSVFAPQGFADGKNSGTVYFAAFDAFANEGGVLQNGSDVKDGGESPAGEHFLELGRNHMGGEVLRVKQRGKQNMHMAVPETGGDNEAFAVDYRGIARDFYFFGGSDSENALLVDENGAIFDGRFAGSGINPGVDESEVRGAGDTGSQKQ